MIARNSPLIPAQAGSARVPPPPSCCAPAHDTAPSARSEWRFATSGSVRHALQSRHAAPAKERVVNVYNWSDYIDPTVLDEFTKETGIKVRYDTFDSNDTLETKLLAGKSGYDVVVPTGYFLERQIKAGVFLKLDKASCRICQCLAGDLSSGSRRYDPGNQYAVNYMWGTTGIGYNVRRRARSSAAMRRRSIAGTSCSSRRCSRSSRIAASICSIPLTNHAGGLAPS